MWTRDTTFGRFLGSKRLNELVFGVREKLVSEVLLAMELVLSADRVGRPTRLLATLQERNTAEKELHLLTIQTLGHYEPWTCHECLWNHKLANIVVRKGFSGFANAGWPVLTFVQPGVLALGYAIQDVRYIQVRVGKSKFIPKMTTVEDLAISATFTSLPSWSLRITSGSSSPTLRVLGAAIADASVFAFLEAPFWVLATAGFTMGSSASRFWDATRADLLGTNSAASVILVCWNVRCFFFFFWFYSVLELRWIEIWNFFFLVAGLMGTDTIAGQWAGKAKWINGNGGEKIGKERRVERWKWKWKCYFIYSLEGHCLMEKWSCEATSPPRRVKNGSTARLTEVSNRPFGETWSEAPELSITIYRSF